MADNRDRQEQERLQRERLAQQERRLELEQGGGGWGWFAAWWWIWIIILIFIVWFGGWGWWGYGGWWGWGARPSAYNMRYQHTVPDSLLVLTSPDKQSYVGRQITLNNVPVQGSAGHNGYWIGPNGEHRLLVVGVNSGALKLHPGELVSVNGTVERAPTAQQAQAEWGLSSDDAQRLEKDGVYVQAGQMQASNIHSR